MKSNGPLHDAANSQTLDVSRRKFLATGAVGIASLGVVGSAAAAPEEHTLTITGTGPRTTYSFTVGGNLEKSTANGATINPQDTIIEQSAHGFVTGGTDSYTFTGPLYSFGFDESNAIDVDLDGEAARVGQRPDHTLLVEGTGPRVDYSFATDGLIEKSDAYGASDNPQDKVNAYGAEGFVTGGKDAYTYNGELQAFDLGGEARVTIDGKAAHVGQRPDQAMILFTEQPGDSAEYEVTVSGSIREVLHDNYGTDYTADGDMISGVVGGESYDKFTFDGDVQMVDSDNPEVLEVYSNYQKVL